MTFKRRNYPNLTSFQKSIIREKMLRTSPVFHPQRTSNVRRRYFSQDKGGRTARASLHGRTFRCCKNSIYNGCIVIDFSILIFFFLKGNFIAKKQSQTITIHIIRFLRVSQNQLIKSVGTVILSYTFLYFRSKTSHLH